MNIREPKFKAGDKVINLEDGHAYTVESINDYKFMQDEYWYNLYEYWYNLSGHLCVFPESALELYIEKPKNVWCLKKGDTYYTVDIDGSVIKERWRDEDYEKSYRNSGNVFLTEEEANFDVERRNIEAKMIKLGGRRKFKKGEYEWRLCYSPYNDSLLVDRSMYYNYGQIIYFSSEKEARAVIEIIGRDRLKKYFIGVEE